MQPADWDPNRRPSTGAVPGMQIAGSPQQQQQQRWESERESDKLESMEVESWKNDVGQSRKLSSEIMLPPQLTEQPSEELYPGPDRIPLELDYTSSITTTTTANINSDPYDFLSSPQISPPTSMSTQQFLPSSSVEGVNRPPSFAEVMRSRSQSIELEKGIMTPEQVAGTSYLGSASGSRRASADSFTGIKMHSRSGSFEVSGGTVDVARSAVPASSSGFMGMPIQQSTSSQPPPPPAQQQQHQPSQVSSIDEKANSLMEELSKLQSAVDSTLKRRQRQQTSQAEDSIAGFRFTPSPRTRSPSPSPTSPIREPFSFKSPESPLRSPPRSVFRSPIESPDSPEVPGVRKAIVLKEHDLDDYKGSSDEESGSGSDEERRGMIASDAFYDHSPGEVYTIPEEEDEGGSPTGGDLVTSLNRPGECFCKNKSCCG